MKIVIGVQGASVEANLKEISAVGNFFAQKQEAWVYSLGNQEILFKMSHPPITKRFSYQEIIALIQKNLSPDLLKNNWIDKSDHPYVASETLYHLIGDAEFKPHVLTAISWPERFSLGETHWFLKSKTHILDPTAGQFDCDVPYERGRRCGFLTAKPSKRSRILQRLLKEIIRGY